MAWKFNDNQPIYRQIAERLTRDILAGVYKPGSQLPSVRDLALTAGVNPNTMQKGLSFAENSDIIFSDRTRGRFVTDDETVIAVQRRDMSREAVRRFFSVMRSFGMGDSEIERAVREFIDSERAESSKQQSHSGGSTEGSAATAAAGIGDANEAAATTAKSKAAESSAAARETASTGATAGRKAGLVNGVKEA